MSDPLEQLVLRDNKMLGGVFCIDIACRSDLLTLLPNHSAYSKYVVRLRCKIKLQYRTKSSGSLGQGASSSA